MKYLSLFLIVTTLSLKSYCQLADKDTVLLFYLGGQSNMEGFGYNSELPDSLKTTLDDVWIFHGNTAADDETGGGIGQWNVLMPGHGIGYNASDKKQSLSDRFGVELSFASKLKQLYPNKKIALIKYSRSGTSIDSMAASHFGCWEPDYTGKTGLNQYDHFLATVRNALLVSDINNDGRNDILVPSGIIWMQGESDASYTEEIALKYHANLKRLMDLIRAALWADDLPVVIGKIADSWNDTDGKVWTYGELVQHAQEKYVSTDKNAAIVRATRYYKYSDPWHYTSPDYIDLGIKFAEAVFNLNQNKK